MDCYLLGCLLRPTGSLPPGVPDLALRVVASRLLLVDGHHDRGAPYRPRPPTGPSEDVAPSRVSSIPRQQQRRPCTHTPAGPRGLPLGATTEPEAVGLTSAPSSPTRCSNTPEDELSGSAGVAAPRVSHCVTHAAPPRPWSAVARTMSVASEMVEVLSVEAVTRGKRAMVRRRGCRLAKGRPAMGGIACRLPIRSTERDSCVSGCSVS